ncbi:P-II family nitrogen regulator [Methanospirillum sp. J.3.6.1-F.2.7.3]|jgi:nitrogen regulatory protein PII|uniref:P-II family nitrogen regulator n=1 Tax=Methanospirillum purgamenti TaxID=2834276 RepID=A0A8E7EGS2_9EURY|nr:MULTISPECIES: P-II family nitrogen regulator [Methanospirillum]MDX8550473.1 P-II family nitrogen regulator [Methanospirillum hungatei]NLW76477.1 P-II family nitrogen regulator [Methanomicrobiales archaeon]QVV88167.1 P-II family nitrogen regulator [Methanospirillum sp. J.3.6.1-F.2.7.3]
MICEGCKDLIVTIVKKGWSERVITASRKAGAEGGTVLMGRGTGIHEMQSILGLPIEPEKEVILTIVEPEQTDEILLAIEKAAQLDTPGMGIAFVISLNKIAGRVHMFCQDKE